MPPISAADRESSSSKEGRRCKKDASDPRNLKAELTPGFLTLHLTLAQMPLREISYYHGHNITTISRMADLHKVPRKNGAAPRKEQEAVAGLQALAAASPLMPSPQKFTSFSQRSLRSGREF